MTADCLFSMRPQTQPLCISLRVEIWPGVTDAWVNSHQVFMPRLNGSMPSFTESYRGLPWLCWLSGVSSSHTLFFSWRPIQQLVFWCWLSTIVLISSTLQGTLSVSMLTCQIAPIHRNTYWLKKKNKPI